MHDRAVMHHTMLQEQGGAARVADMLAAWRRNRSLPVYRRWETATDGAAGVSPDQALFPGATGPFGDTIPDDAVMHLHSTADWDAVLESASATAARPTVITFHDCNLLTGGCPYPLECTGVEQGCLAPCPRSFPDAPARQSRRRAMLQQLAPVCAAPSSWLARQVRAALPSLSCRVVPNGVEWPERPPDKAAARAALGVPERARIALFAAHGGERAAYKAGPVWRPIWDTLKASLEDVLGFFVGGDTSDRDGDLFLLPYVDQTTMHAVLSAADVLVYPSYADNHPLLILEAMAAGLPVTAWSVGGIPEQVAHGETGLLCPRGDARSIAEAAATLLRSPARAKRLAAAAWSKGRGVFSADRMGSAYEKLYSALPDGRTHLK